MKRFLKGIGIRKWFLHQLSIDHRHFDSRKYIKMGFYSQNLIQDKKFQNILLCYYEGIINEDEKNFKENQTAFGRSLYTNFEKSFYVGYMLGNEKHTKGVLVRKNQAF